MNSHQVFDELMCRCTAGERDERNEGMTPQLFKFRINFKIMASRALGKCPRLDEFLISS